MVTTPLLLNRRFLLGVWTVNSPQSHIVRVYDAGHGKSGVFHSAEWHDGDWSPLLLVITNRYNSQKKKVIYLAVRTRTTSVVKLI
ncbi:hypothetical protein TNCV_965431 [Trichonephila clavipes]|nr:hypothetical protein TNCV_965431 [Trichonephila clavipes]